MKKIFTIPALALLPALFLFQAGIARGHGIEDPFWIWSSTNSPLIDEHLQVLPGNNPLRPEGVEPGALVQIISAADRVLSSVSTAGRQILDDLQAPVDPDARPSSREDSGSGDPPGDPRPPRG